MALLQGMAEAHCVCCSGRAKRRGYFALEPANATAPENGVASAARAGGSDVEGWA